MTESDLQIDCEHYLTVPGTTTMICAIVMKDGTVFVGKHSASPGSFDAEASRVAARYDAITNGAPAGVDPDDLQAALGQKAAE